MISHFKELLIELDELSRAGKASVFRRAKIIAELVTDEGYAQFLQTDDGGEVRRKLCRYISELAVNVDDLLVMLEFAPDEATWVSTPLRELRDSAYMSRIKRGEPGRPKKSNPREEQLRQQVEKLKLEIKEVRHENRQLLRRLHAIEKTLQTV